MTRGCNFDALTRPGAVGAAASWNVANKGSRQIQVRLTTTTAGAACQKAMCERSPSNWSFHVTHGSHGLLLLLYTMSGDRWEIDTVIT